MPVPATPTNLPGRRTAGCSGGPGCDHDPVVPIGGVGASPVSGAPAGARPVLGSRWGLGAGSWVGVGV